MYILEGDGRASIARRPVKIEVTGKDGSGRDLQEGSVLLAARCGEAAAPDTHSSRPSLLILRAVDDLTAIRVLPGRGQARFAEGTSLNLTIRVDRTHDADEDVVVVRDVPVSGIGFRDMVEICPLDAAKLQVTALAIVEDTPLGPLAAAARAAARHRLGIERVAKPRDVLIAVDMSASMSSVFADGTVAAVTDVVVGLAQVLGFGRSLVVCLLAEQPVFLPPVEPAAVGAATADSALRLGLGCGFRAVSTALRLPTEGVTFVVTDGVPSDADAVQALRQHGRDVQLVLTGGRPPSPWVDGLPATVVASTRDGGDVATYLLSSPEGLTHVVGSMLDKMLAVMS